MTRIYRFTKHNLLFEIKFSQMDLPQIDLSEYPDLARPYRWEWGPIDGLFELSGEPPEDQLISNVRIVPFVGDDVVVLKMASGNWDHPGGTRGPGEAVLETARRELLEEAGAKLVSLESFGVFRCHSYAKEPFRPHLPHPDFCHLVVTAEVELVGEPGNPEGETDQTEQVLTVSLEDAVSRFVTRDDGGLWMADMYRLGAEVRQRRRKS